MRNKKLIFLTGGLVIIIINSMMVFANVYIERLLPIKEILKRSWIFILIISVVLIFVFKIIEYYYTQLNNHVQSMKTLNEAFLKLSSNLKIDNLSTAALSLLIDFYKGEKGILVLTDGDMKKYVSDEIFSIQKGVPKRTSLLRRRYHIFSPGKLSAEMEKEIKKLLKEYHFYECSSIIVLPFCDEEITRAVAVIGTHLTDKKSLESLKSVIDIFIKQLMVYFENSLLHEEVNKASITDPLTQLYNRRYFQVRLKEAFSDAKRRGFPVSIMISDFDNFKHYVDTYGHPKSDVILSEAAMVIKDSVRESDIVCRFGGDEFAYLLPYASSFEAKNVAERVKEQVSSYSFLEKEDGIAVHLTLSIGIASFPEHGASQEKTLTNADYALFHAKENGKDRICIFQNTEEKNEFNS